MAQTCGMRFPMSVPCCITVKPIASTLPVAGFCVPRNADGGHLSVAPQ